MAMPWSRTVRQEPYGTTHQNVNPAYKALQNAVHAVYSLTHPRQVYATTQAQSGAAVVEAPPRPAPPTPAPVVKPPAPKPPEREPGKKRRWYTNPAIVGPLAAVVLGAGIVAATKGDDVYRFVTGKTAQTSTNTGTAGTNENTQTQKPLTYWQSPDGSTTVHFPGLTQADVQPFIDGAHQKAQSEKSSFTGTVTPDRKLVRQKTAANGKVVVEQDCGPVTKLECDDLYLNKITAREEETLRLIDEAFQPSKKVGLYVTASPDGKRANVTYFMTENHLKVGRESQLSFYPWHVTDDWTQMTWESGVAAAHAQEYTAEGFLNDFWGGAVSEIRKAGNQTLKINRPTIGSFSKDKSVAGLALEVYEALVIDGYSKSDFTQLAQRLEGTNARWEKFKAEAKTVAGKDMPTLDSLDGEVQLYREFTGKKSAAVIKDRNAALARILEENPELNTPTYIRSYYGQFA